MVSEIDPNQQLKSLSKEGENNTLRTLHQSKSTVKAGEVPKVQIIAEKARNKKVTHAIGVELFKIDTQEMAKFLRNKCQASVTVNREKLKDKEFEVITIQGNMIRDIDETLQKRYKVPQKYIQQTNNIGPSKKKK